MAGSITQVNASHKSRGIVRIDVTVTTDASGTATATDIGTAYGRLVAIGCDGGLADTADVSLTLSSEGASVVVQLNDLSAGASWSRFTEGITDNTGSAITAASTASNINRDFFAAGTLKFGVANGGNAQTGKYSFVIDEDGLGGFANQ